MMRRDVFWYLLGAFCWWSTSAHKNNWAIIVDTSRYWYNYRHIANALSFYHTVKRLGIPDSQIILLIAEDVACNPRSPLPGRIFSDSDHAVNLYGGGSGEGRGVEVDFRGDYVSVRNFIRLITGRQDPHVPLSQRLNTDHESNILVYMTGHGGNEFLKFQDWEELNSWDIAHAFAQMHEQRRYKNVFFLADTCQAATLHKRFYTPNILAAGSAKLGENSYSHHSDGDLGLAVIDRFTYYSVRNLRQIQPWSDTSIQEFFDTLSVGSLHSTPEIRTDLFSQSLSEAKVIDFFASSGDFLFYHNAFPISRRQEKAEHKDMDKIPAEMRSYYSCYFSYEQEGIESFPNPVYFRVDDLTRPKRRFLSSPHVAFSIAGVVAGFLSACGSS